MTTEHQLLCAFGEGDACARKGGYLSDNPHAWESEKWQAWREGFNMIERDRRRAAECKDPQHGLRTWLQGASS